MANKSVVKQVNAAAPAKLALSDESGTKKSASTLLIELAKELTLFTDGRGDAYAQMQNESRVEYWPLRSRTFQHWLDSQHYALTRRGASRTSVVDALDTLEARARFDGEKRQVASRVAGDNKKIHIDLCNDAWQSIEITKNGWRIVDSAFPFIRKANMQALPIPRRGGSLKQLRRFINATDDAAGLIVAWILAALRPHGPYPVLILQGEQGTGKSTITRLVRSLVDPSSVLLRSLPKDESDLLIGAINNHVVALDNLSGLQNWQSDALCRLSTGGGFAARTLYTNTEETSFHLQRPIILNGIEDIPHRPDLADRALVVTLDPLHERRRAERDLALEWEEARPYIFGALLDAQARAMRDLTKTRLNNMPRMADFFQWTVAGLGLGFIKSYEKNQSNLIEESLASSPLAGALQALLCDKGSWEGTPSELRVRLGEKVTDETRRSIGWPSTERALKNQITRLKPHLRHVGIYVEEGRTSKRRLYRITGRSILIENQASQASSKMTSDGRAPKKKKTR